MPAIHFLLLLFTLTVHVSGLIPQYSENQINFVIINVDLVGSMIESLIVSSLINSFSFAKQKYLQVHEKKMEASSIFYLLQIVTPGLLESPELAFQHFFVCKKSPVFCR